MRDDIKDIAKFILRQFELITVILLALMGLLKLLNVMSGGSADSFPWYFPLQVIGVSFPTALCSLIFVSTHELTKKEFLTRCIIHLVLLLIVVFGEGFLFQWWSEITGMIIVAVIFIIIYICVWVITTLQDKKNSDRINKALHNVNKKEE